MKVWRHSYQNEFGQIIQPDDPVLIALTNSHYTNVVRGTYHGIIDGEKGNLSVSYESMGFVRDASGEYDWSKRVPTVVKTYSKKKMVYKYVP